MKILTVIDSFKGTISSKELGQITKEVLEKKGHTVDNITIADGGDGFLDAMEDILKEDVKRKGITVYDPLFRKIETYYLDAGKTAYVELAKSSGINLLTKEELNPYIASTYGTGEVINECLNQGYENIVIGIGGSATNDCGVGMLEALGVKFYDKDNNLLDHVRNIDLPKICYIDESVLKEKIKNVNIKVLSDVANTLLGEFGATYVFSRQKGAKTCDLVVLEENIKQFSKFKKEVREFAGSGAAGGVGYALRGYLNAEYHSGLDYILDLVDYETLIKEYDYIITGEGKVDNQSLMGKVVFKICTKSLGKKVIIVCAIDETKEIDLIDVNVHQIYSIVGNGVTKEKSMKEAKKYYQELVERIKL